MTISTEVVLACILAGLLGFVFGVPFGLSTQDQVNNLVNYWLECKREDRKRKLKREDALEAEMAREKT